MSSIRFAATLALACVMACGNEAVERSPEAYAGRVLPQPQPRPSFVLSTTDGRKFDFQEETGGRLTFLFFGYTNCPDICPVHMANLAGALDRLPQRATRGVRVVFVTTDPQRDTPERIRKWLDSFDSDFIGLTGSEIEVMDAQTAAGLLPASRELSNRKNYLVGHAPQVLAYTRDDSLRAIYSVGAKKEDWIQDIPLLQRFQAGS